MDATRWLRVVTSTTLPGAPAECSNGLSSSHLCSSSFQTSSRTSRYLLRPTTSCRRLRNSSILSGKVQFPLVANSIMDLTRETTLKSSETQSHMGNSKRC
ncbi:Os08g0543051 [Oryza sativa Japonica Group]|uniref:Os08g0543051 protein n=1 Tax=Oryza sativa subsp. japonica TaxID=39947 RepID=A0A0P0XIY6_ORYSJ|nr:hypothetical protein EE612_045694 [Oryza sativa]BAT06512.1 Os08g0543051 [Oryza sativa Japonica Group]